MIHLYLPWTNVQPIVALKWYRSEEHTSELQSQSNLVCRLLLEKKNILHQRPLHFNAPPHSQDPVLEPPTAKRPPAQLLRRHYAHLLELSHILSPRHSLTDMTDR